MEKRKLNSDSYIIACNFLQNMHRFMIFAHPGSEATKSTRPYTLLNFWPMTDVLLVFIFFCAIIFLFYSVAWLGAVSNMCDVCLFLGLMNLHIYYRSYFSC